VQPLQNDITRFAGRIQIAKRTLLLALLTAVLVVSLISSCNSGSQSDIEAGNTQTQTTAPTSPVTTSVDYGPPVFQVSDMIIKPRVPATGEPFDVSVVVANSGGPGEYRAELTIDEIFQSEGGIEIYDTKVFDQTIDIEANQTKTVVFDSLYLQEGIFIISIEGLEDYIEVGC